MTFLLCHKVHQAGSAALAQAQLDWNCAYKAKAGILQKDTVWTTTVKCHYRHGMTCM